MDTLPGLGYSRNMSSDCIGGTGPEERNWEPLGFAEKVEGVSARQGPECFCFSLISVWLLMLLALSFFISKMRIITPAHTCRET